jgi:NAD(P)-dependent dehydrogenase (short-subunit alcohol dehydrogenase family)
MPLAPSHPAGTPLLPPGVFTGRVAVITEPADAVGQAIAVELARGGAEIVLADESAAACAETAKAVAAVGGKSRTVEVRLADAASVKAAFDEIERTAGPISILVNHMRARPDCPVELMDVAQWQDVTRRVLDGTFNACRELGLRRIADGGPAAIVNSGSPYDVTGGAGRAHTNAAQSAVMNLTKSLAVEWAPYDIRINGVAPGYVAGAEAGPVSEAEHEATVPAGRLCEPHEIAWCVAYMCSPFAAYLTGHTLVIDGGSWERPGRSPPLFQPIRARYESAAAKR